ncbi:MAG: response regulator [Candidatus Cloacimonadales bacterium]|nr:response regulator [Candidatus Cloacimonadales bacterium]
MKKKIKILIVEDEVIIAECLKMELELSGYDVCDFVTSGEEAIIIAKEKDPDVILMDIYLAGVIDGIEAAKEIIANKKIPIIFCTGYTESEIFERAKKLNPVAYLRKPIIAEEVKVVLEYVFE